MLKAMVTKHDDDKKEIILLLKPKLWYFLLLSLLSSDDYSLGVVTLELLALVAASAQDLLGQETQDLLASILIVRKCLCLGWCTGSMGP